jgi:hypothetical protein
MLQGHRLFIDYNNGTRTETWYTPAAIFLGVEYLPSNKTLHFCQREKKQLA